jgi:hypothetical protein
VYILYKMGKNGGAIESQDLKHFLSESYSKKHKDYKDFVLDKDLSGKKTQVYYNPKTGQSVVAHRGTATMTDWMTDARYALGKTDLKRFRHAKDIQQKAESKYGGKNVTTIGHSLGAKASELVGKNSKEIITLNKPVTLKDLIYTKVPKNQTDIKTTYDPVSVLRPLQRGNKAKTINSETKNPLTEHSTETLDREPINRMYGSGRINERGLYYV